MKEVIGLNRKVSPREIVVKIVICMMSREPIHQRRSRTMISVGCA
jgi:hypothetical protein